MRQCHTLAYLASGNKGEYSGCQNYSEGGGSEKEKWTPPPPSGREKEKWEYFSFSRPDDQNALGNATNDQNALGTANNDQNALGTTPNDQSALGTTTNDQNALGTALGCKGKVKRKSEKGTRKGEVERKSEEGRWGMAVGKEK